jgi:cytochrome P450
MNSSKPDYDVDAVRQKLNIFPQAPHSKITQLIEFNDQPHQFFIDYFRKFGDTFVVKAPLELPSLAIAHPEDIKTIMNMSEGDWFSGDLGLYINFGPKCLLFVDGEPHRRARQLLAPPVNGKILESYADYMKQATLEKISHWKQTDNIVMVDEMADITLKIITRCIFGAEERSQEKRLRDLFEGWLKSICRLPIVLLSMIVGTKKYREFLDKRITDYINGKAFPIIYPGRKSIKIKAEFMRLISEDVICCRSKEISNRNDVLALLSHSQYEDGQLMGVDEIVDQLTLMFSAGHETTAKSVSWAIYDILSRPDVHKKIMAELDQAFGPVKDGSEINALQCRELSYFNSVIKESMRLTPVVNMIGRQLARDLPLRKGIAPVGTVIQMLPGVVQRHPDYWDTPDEFIPERFIDYKPENSLYFPFGGGKTRCIGEAFAMLELPIMVAVLLRHCEFNELPRVQPKPVFGGITIGPKGGMPLRVERIRI